MVGQTWMYTEEEEKPGRLCFKTNSIKQAKVSLLELTHTKKPWTKEICWEETAQEIL